MQKWTPKHEAPEPLEGNSVAVAAGGAIIWVVLFIGLLPFYGWLDDNDRTWWLWTCLVGAALGVFGVWFCRRRDAAIARSEAARTTAE